MNFSEVIYLNYKKWSPMGKVKNVTLLVTIHIKYIVWAPLLLLTKYII